MAKLINPEYLRRTIEENCSPDGTHAIEEKTGCILLYMIDSAPALEWHTITCRELDAEEREYYEEYSDLVDVILEDCPEDGEECLLNDGTFDIWCDLDREGVAWEGCAAEPGQKWISISELLWLLNGGSPR